MLSRVASGGEMTDPADRGGCGICWLWHSGHCSWADSTVSVAIAGSCILEVIC